MNNKKILIAVLSLILLFAVSCSNEKTTGGGVSPTSPEADIGTETGTESGSGSGTGTGGGSGTSKPEEKKIIKVTSATTQEPAIIFFTDPDPELGKINKVEVTTPTPIGHDTDTIAGNHFTYNKDTGELKLTDTSGGGLYSVGLISKGEYKYKLKFRFNDDWKNEKSVEITIIKDYE